MIQETCHFRIPPAPPSHNNGNIEYCSANKRTSLDEGEEKVCLLLIVDGNMWQNQILIFHNMKLIGYVKPEKVRTNCTQMTLRDRKSNT